MENKNIPNGANNETEVVKKAAPPPMKRAKKGETSKEVMEAAKKAATQKKEEPKKVKPAIIEEDNIKEQGTEEKNAAVPVAPAKNTADVPSAKQKAEKTEAPKAEAPKAEAKPPVKAEPEKKEEKATVKAKKSFDKKNLKFIIPIVAVVLAAIIIAILLVASKNRLDPVVVTDNNGVPVTDENGDVITVRPETEIIFLTDSFGNTILDADGNPFTQTVYKDITVQVPVTDMNGVIVTDSKGNAVTENIVMKPTAGDKNNKTTTEGNKVVGTTSVLITDGKGNTGVDEQGNVLTTIVDITESTTIDIKPAKTEWKNTQGGSANDKYADVILTTDDCYITANVTNSKDGDFTKYKDLNISAPYTVLTKFNKAGEIVWQKPFGTLWGMFEIVSLSPCTNGEFYAAGYSRGIDDAESRGYYDGVLYKLDKNGNVIWVKTFGTSTVDMFNGVTTAANGDAIVVGSVGNNDGDASDSGGEERQSKAILLRYSPNGDLRWKKYVGGNRDVFNAVVEAKDSSIYVLGHFYSGKLFPALGKCDSGVLKYSKDGKLLEKASIAGSGIDDFKGITATSDGGVIVCGQSNSADTNENSFFKNEFASRGSYDSYMIKYTEDLNVRFITPVRGQNIDTATSVMELSNGTYIMAGSTNSSTRDFKGVTTRGKKDIFVAGVNSGGTLMWVRSFGGTESDAALALCKGADGGYVVVGETFSNNVDLNKISPYGGNGKTLAVMVKFPE